jgi:hypothetical protein
MKDEKQRITRTDDTVATRHTTNPAKTRDTTTTG